MNEKAPPAVDIVIIARNESRHLGTVLQAIAAQNYAKELFKVFVVDNDSDDDTSSIARQHGACVVPHSGTVAAGRNAGIQVGQAPLIGFLDAHCVPQPQWLSLMTAQFKDRSVGGCMGSIENVCRDLVVAELTKYSALSQQRLFAATISGLTSTWPWVVTGNCMIRRSAFDTAGGFNPALFRCEDTDISWRLVLSGFQLVYEGRANVVHYEDAPLSKYLNKHYDYGVGAAQLAHAYGLAGTRDSSDSALMEPGKQMLDEFYTRGFAREDARIKSEVGAQPSTYSPSPISDDLRQPFEWSSERRLRISSNVVYWFSDEGQAIVATLKAPQRYVFDDVAAEILRALSRRLNRDKTIETLQARYDVERDQLASDTDAFVETLLDACLLVRV